MHKCKRSPIHEDVKQLAQWQIPVMNAFSEVIWNPPYSPRLVPCAGVRLETLVAALPFRGSKGKINMTLIVILVI